MFDYSDHLTRARCGMKTRARRWASLVLLAAAAVSPSGAQSLESLATAYRESPTPARRTALLRFASANAGTEQGALARFTLGVVAYEAGDYAAAAENLELARTGLPRLRDYASYYLAAARVAAKDFAGVEADLAPFRSLTVPSPVSGKALLVQAQALAEAGRHADALKVLSAQRTDLPQPDGDLAMAEAYRRLGQLPEAVRAYHQVYYGYPNTGAAAKASDALVSLRQSMGDAYPLASAAMRLERINKWIAARDYGRARAELGQMGDELSGAERDTVKVRYGALDALQGRSSQAARYLKSLSVSSDEAQAERLYYLAYCARGDDSEMLDRIEDLEKFPQSPWRFKALILGGNRYLLQNRTDKYVPLFRAAADSFPSEPEAPYAHWKVTWNAYLHRRSDAPALLHDHLTRFPDSSKASAALYFLGRISETGRDLGAAAAFYQEILARYPNFYYALLARQRTAAPELIKTSASETTVKFLRSLALPEPRQLDGVRPTPATERRIARARQLTQAGFPDWAQGELRFGARNDAQPQLLAVEVGRLAKAPHQAVRAVKSLIPDYLYFSFHSAPQRFWEVLFPLPWRRTLVAQANRRDLDPFMVAGLIRQESEFNPGAISRAKAYGLTQVLPSTGRQLARKEGIRRFRPSMLLQPETNLRLGITYLQLLLNQWGGRWEEALASYNAGKSRVDEWLTWANYREPAEFVETIPFTETREYVQSVMRNADFYRRLYGDKAFIEAALEADKTPEPTPAAVKSKKSKTVKPAVKKRAVKRATPAKRTLQKSKPRSKATRPATRRAERLKRGAGRG